MAKYTGSEEDVKNGIYLDWFKKYKWETLGKIDFAVYGLHQDEPYYFLWAEAKKGDNHDIYDSFVQLILTVGKERPFTKHTPPMFFGAFDGVKIGFIEFKEFRDIFNKNDFDWTVAPSDHSTDEFLELKNIVLDKLESKVTLFLYEEDKDELKEFIKKNFVFNLTKTEKILIDDDSFPEVFQKWYRDVFPTIEDFSDMDVMAGDFFLADLMDKSELSFDEKLRIVLKYKNDEPYYEVKDKYVKKRDKFNFNNINFSIKAYTKFWNKYERPPLEEYIKTIISRRDLLVLPDIREKEGSFFTPQIWSKLSKDYLRRTFGKGWQKKKYIWDCCAGTGNLLFNLTQPYRIFASTLSNSDVLVMKEVLKETVVPSHIFQFDFLEDEFDCGKLPDDLKRIIKDEPENLIIYINPPYEEADAKVGRGRRGVSANRTSLRYEKKMGYARREIFIQFFTRIYEELRGCKLAEFSKLKILQAPAFKKYREYFMPKLKSLFLVPADTFDNVTGIFPIGFFIWDTAKQEVFKKIKADCFDKDGNELSEKIIMSYDGQKLINDWTLDFIEDKKLKRGSKDNDSIGNIIGVANDFQHKNTVCIERPWKPWNHQYQWQISRNNIIQTSIYFSVRLCIPATWLNDRDQFLYPNDGWKTDEEFKSNCLAYTLFHGQNRISSVEGTNHWIPFEEMEVGASERYESHFMIDFIKGKIGAKKEENLFDEDVDTQIFSSLPNKPIVFSEKAQKVMDAGKALWSYYHSECGENPNASYYDIKMHFQKKNDKGKMNPKSEDDDKYNELHDRLKAAMKVLAKEIEVKVYEYGFLMK